MGTTWQYLRRSLLSRRRPLLGALSAVGLGFLINDMILIPVLALFLGATIWGLLRDRKRHGKTGPAISAGVAAILSVAGLWISSVVVGLGLAILVASSVWNFTAVRTAKQG